jgi:hypothetical protein
MKRLRFEYDGKMLSAYALGKICGISQGVLLYRLRAGWAVFEAMNTPIRPPGVNSGQSKGSIDKDISRKEKAESKKIRDVGMFAQCSARINSK